MENQLFHFRFKSLDGRIVPEYPNQVRVWLKATPEGEWIEGDFYPEKRKRSLKQNNTVWGKWMDLIMKEEYGEPFTKAEKQTVYDSIKFEMEWIVEKVNVKTGEVKLFPRDTHTLDTKGYSNWMEMFARHIAMNHGINLPPPNRINSLS